MPSPYDRQSQSYQGTAPGFLWAIVCIVLLILPFVIGFSDDVAVLYPDRNNTLLMWSVAVCFGLLSMAIGLYFFRNSPARWVLSVLLLLMSCDAAASLTWCIATRVESAHDFPRGEVKTTQELVPIITATRSTGGRGRVDRVLQLSQGWPSVEVEGEDYSFMLRHRPASSGATREKIASNGFFCAIVSVEETATAKRIVGLKSRKLPARSVSFCPPK